MKLNIPLVSIKVLIMYLKHTFNPKHADRTVTDDSSHTNFSSTSSRFVMVISSVTVKTVSSYKINVFGR